MCARNRTDTLVRIRLLFHSEEVFTASNDGPLVVMTFKIANGCMDEPFDASDDARNPGCRITAPPMPGDTLVTKLMGRSLRKIGIRGDAR